VAGCLRLQRRQLGTGPAVRCALDRAGDDRVKDKKESEGDERGDSKGTAANDRLVDERVHAATFLARLGAVGRRSLPLRCFVAT
jgi:hypothetical protein